MVIKKKVIKSESAQFLWVENVNNSDINKLIKNKGLFRFKVFDKVEKEEYDVLVDPVSDNMIYWKEVFTEEQSNKDIFEFLKEVTF
jgi:hypothetical protein